MEKIEVRFLGDDFKFYKISFLGAITQSNDLGVKVTRIKVEKNIEKLTEVFSLVNIFHGCTFYKGLIPFVSGVTGYVDGIFVIRETKGEIITESTNENIILNFC